MADRLPRLAGLRPSDAYERPLLEVDDLDARPEWHRGCAALMALVSELNLQSTQTNRHSERLAQWHCGGMLISVELAYGTPIIALEVDQHRTMILLADAEFEKLRAEVPVP
jgi:hypothetical protein